MSAPIYPVLLCGGSGTRLWPLSRQSFPKQFARILGSTSLFQQAIARLPEPDFAPPIIVTSSDFRFIVEQQLDQMSRSPKAILIEPEGRNTAPAVLAAALFLERNDATAMMLVCPSDHAIPDASAFRDAIVVGRAAAEAGQLVTFGIRPTRPEQGYGYLEIDDGITESRDAGPVPIYPVRRFVEKPDHASAAAMVADGRHLWNSGIFLFSVAAIVAAYERFQPEMTRAVRAAVSGAEIDLSFLRLEATQWGAATGVSLDYAIMEKATDVVAVPFGGRWSDLGAWDAIAQEMELDGGGNALKGPAYPIDCRDCLLRAESDDQVLVGLGLRDIVAVAMQDAVLVADRSAGQQVGMAVALLKAKEAPQATGFSRFHRPWGWYQVLSHGHRFQVKRIMVHPGGVLSLQSHVHRAEHWVVVEGTAKVTVGDEVRLVGEDESIYVPLGAVHRLENPGKLDLHVIEVQSGSYLGEDDIIRYDDVYARN